MNISIKLFALSALVLSASCGGGSDPAALIGEGTAAMASSDYETAASKFESAIAGLDAGSTDHLKASLGRCRALAHTDAAKAKTEFLQLVEGGKVIYTHYNQMTVAFAGAGAWNEAIEVLTVGKEKLPEEKKMEQLVAKVGDQAKNSGASSEAMKALEGLGYVGN